MTKTGWLGVPRWLRPILVLTVLALAGCDLIGPGDDRRRAELERYWSVWQQRGDDDYAYVQQRLCYCPIEVVTPVRVLVQDGVVIERSYASDDIAVPLQFSSLWGTIDDLFRLIESALDNGAGSVDVSYHAALGYPTHISIDYIASAVDDELSITVRNVEFVR